MLPDRVSIPGPLTYESGALPIALRGPAYCVVVPISIELGFHVTFNVKFNNLLQGIILSRRKYVMEICRHALQERKFFSALKIKVITSYQFISQQQSFFS